MKSFLKHTTIERVQPWLGTYVSVRVEKVSMPKAHRAIDAAFAEIALVHRLMSFHSKESDVTALNRNAFRKPVKVHEYTSEVLQQALKFSAFSDGCFDITSAAKLVDWQFLPCPAEALCDSGASWHDIELTANNEVLFHRSLWIDLGGIAKGYAVDRAAAVLVNKGIENYVINAGGDLRVGSGNHEQVTLNTGFPLDTLPVITMNNGSIASSTGLNTRKLFDGQLVGPHVDGRLHAPVPTDRFVSVLAGECITADALTKIVLAQESASEQILKIYGAHAHIYKDTVGWIHL